MSEKITDNRLLHRAILHALPPGFLGALVMTFGFMVDTVLAGLFFDGKHIACIGIVMPFQMFLCSVLDIFINGSMVLLTKNMGRGDHSESNRMYSFAIYSTALLGLFFVAVSLIFAPQIMPLLGARDAQTIAISASYLRALSPLFIFGPLNMLANKLLALNGLHSESVAASIAMMVANALISFVLVKTTNMGLAALALGSAIASLPPIITAFIILKRNNALLKFSFVKLNFREVIDVITLGFPESGDRLAESVSSGIINNILVSGIGIIAVAIYTVARSIYMLMLCAVRAAEQSSAPLFGLLYGARDRNGIRRVTKSTLFLGIAFTFIWFLVVMACMPLCLTLYGVTPDKGLDAEVIRTGVLVMSAFFPIAFFNRLLTGVYQSTEQAAKSAINAIIADSLVFPLMLGILVPRIGYMGIWLSYGLSYIVFYIVFWLIISIKNKRPAITLDDILSLPEALHDNVPQLDISISDQRGAIVGISSKIHSFLIDKGIAEQKAYAASLCLEEIAVEFNESSARTAKNSIFDIKLFVEGDAVAVNVRSAGNAYNPIDFEYNPETFDKIGVYMVRKIAQKIEYNYLYKINIINITL